MKKKNCPRQGARKKKFTLCLRGEILKKFSKKKNHSREGDRKKNPPLLSEKKSPPDKTSYPPGNQMVRPL